jgi:hypothetical protein
VLLNWDVDQELYGLNQDYASTRQGLKDAVEAGALDIESHGWTHMEPNLDSPPGPWWTADLSGEGSMVGWYAEFADQRRSAATGWNLSASLPTTTP